MTAGKWRLRRTSTNPSRNHAAWVPAFAGTRRLCRKLGTPERCLSIHSQFDPAQRASAPLCLVLLPSHAPMELRHEHRKQALSHRSGPHRVLCRLAEASPRAERVAAARSLRFRPDRERSQNRARRSGRTGSPRPARGRRTPANAGAAWHRAANGSDSAQPLLLRDMERVCSLCHHKARCNLELVTGTVVENYHGYCGNAATLESLDRADVAPR